MDMTPRSGREMEYQQRNTPLRKSRNGNLGSFIFPTGNDDLSVEPIDNVQNKYAALSESHPKPPNSQPKGTTTPVIFKVESAASSMSSPSEVGIIRPPCSKRSQTKKKSTTKSSVMNVAESRNDENPVMTLQKLMSKRTQGADESSRMEPEPPRGWFADIDGRIHYRRKAGTTPPPEERKMPPIYHTIIEDTRYPKPQDTLDDVFNVLEHAMCPNPNISMKKDALDTFFGAAEKVICGPDPRYAYQRKKIESGDDDQEEQEKEHEKNRLLHKAIKEKHVLTMYPRLIAEGAKSKNYDLVVAAAERASKLTLEAPKTISPPSVAKLQESPHRKMMVENQDLLDVICNQVEAATCNPRNNRPSLLIAHGQQKRLQGKDALDLFCEGVEHQVCGASLASEEIMITFDDPEEEKRQALQRLFKPPTRNKGNLPKVSTIFTPPAMNRTKLALPQVNTILPPALMRRQAASRPNKRSSPIAQDSSRKETEAMHHERSRHPNHQRRRDPPPSDESSNEATALQFTRATRPQGEEFINEEPNPPLYKHNRERTLPNMNPQVFPTDGKTDLENVFYWVPSK